MAQETNRHRLRRATAAAHASLEAVVGPIADARNYRRYLRGLTAFRAPLEAALRDVDWPTGFGAWRPIAIAGDLRLDLADLALQPVSEISIAPLHDSTHLLGALYVIEGSALGARIVSGAAQGLGFDATFGARHLATQTAGTANWRDFVQLLDQQPEHELDGVSNAANATFKAAEEAMLRAADAAG